MTLLSTLREAAFWHQWLCLACGCRIEEDEASGGNWCPECDERQVVDARIVLGVVEQVATEGELE